MSPVTNFLFSFQTLTNYWVTTNLAYDLFTTNFQAITTATNFVTATNYAVTNVVITVLLTTNYVATNTALVIITNGPNEIVLNPVINNYAETFQLNLDYDTNYFAISNNFALSGRLPTISAAPPISCWPPRPRPTPPLTPILSSPTSGFPPIPPI